jgi:hypothetical protein
MSDDSGTLYCANHPQTTTRLRCNRCEKPICAKCAVLTPTGYRCKECVRGQQKVYDTAKGIDYPLLFGVVVILTAIGGLAVEMLGFFSIFLAPVVGMIIARVARFVTQKRRSRNLFRLAIVAAVVGCLPFIGLNLYYFDVRGLIFQGIYLFLMTSTFYYRLAGIKIG